MASIYGEHPPMVNMARKPGEWQSLDIIFEAPKFNGLVRPGYFTILWNGVIVHNRTELWGITTPIMTPHVYAPHEAELPLTLQGRARVRYRNIWIRRLQGTTSAPKAIDSGWRPSSVDPERVEHVAHRGEHVLLAVDRIGLR